MLLGIEGGQADLKKRWIHPNQRQMQIEVPDVIGLSLESAALKLSRTHLRLGDVSYMSSEKSQNTVIDQQPLIGTTVLSKSNIDLVVSSGANVKMPNVVGKPLSQALVMLHESGLESEPEIVFTKSKDRPKNQVLGVTPTENSYITPQSTVVLDVSSGPTK